MTKQTWGERYAFLFGQTPLREDAIYPEWYEKHRDFISQLLSEQQAEFIEALRWMEVEDEDTGFDQLKPVAVMQNKRWRSIRENLIQKIKGYGSSSL